MATPDEVGASLTNLQTTADQLRTQVATRTPEDLDRLRDQIDVANAGLAEWLPGPSATGKKK